MNSHDAPIHFQENNAPPGDSVYPVSLTLKLARYAWILRYHRPAQLIQRATSVAKRRLAKILPFDRWSRLPVKLPQPRANADFQCLVVSKLATRAAIAPIDSANQLMRGEFTLIGVFHQLPDPVDWRLADWPDAPGLWRFHLHYHEFLLDLVAKGQQNSSAIYFTRAWDLVRQWIQRNRPGDASTLMDAWHPFCISRRLPVWIALWTAAPPPAELRESVLESVFLQTRFLVGHLEKDLGGNHLLENLRAIILAAAMLDGPDADRWLRDAGRGFVQQLDEQILPHGEHFERSPMYHAHMLEAVLDVRDAVALLDRELAERCATKADRMAQFLKTILHPDGDIPLLGDACLKETPRPIDLIKRASVEFSPVGSSRRMEPDTAKKHPNPVLARTANSPFHLSSFREIARRFRLLRAEVTYGRQEPDTAVGNCALTSSPSGPEGSTRGTSTQTIGGYWTLRDDDGFILFDAAPTGPDHLPAHAHADLLTFEASFSGRRLFVDAGVFSYQDDAMRQYCRGTAAHNTLEIDGLNQCDVWSRFRMGRRGWAHGLTSGQFQDFHWARAWHDAYRGIGVPRVTRWMAYQTSGTWLMADVIDSKSQHRLTSRLRIHPDWQVSQTDDKTVEIRGDRTTFLLRPLTGGTVQLTDGWYCPEFGQRHACPIVQWTATADFCGWMLSRFLGPRGT